MKKLIQLERLNKAGFYFLFIASLFMRCSKNDPPPKPLASFTYSVGANGLVNFSNTSKNAKSYSWDFGDSGASSFSASENPTYTYITNDSFTVTLTVTGPGGTATATNVVTIKNVTGKITFWTSTGFACSPFNVTIGNTSAAITKFPGSPPSCGDSGLATFDLLAGKYNYSATCGGLSWSGSISVNSGCNVYDFPSGYAMFFTKSSGYGTITVTVSGITNTIIKPNLSPGSICGDPNSAIYILPPGTYNYTAIAYGVLVEYTWSGSIVINNKECSQVQLL